jgi:anti-sigma regulatory factor (Ser/Thr protein kinase)
MPASHRSIVRLAAKLGGMTRRSDACTTTNFSAKPSSMKNGATAGIDLRRMSFLELAPLPSAVPCARLHATQILREWGLQELAGDAELVISELMTNAITASAALSGRPPVLLQLIAGERSVRVEVHDRSPLEAVPLHAGANAEHGCGLTIVAALSQRYGSQRTAPDHKLVWAEVGG